MKLVIPFETSGKSKVFSNKPFYKLINRLPLLTAVYTELWEGETGTEAQQVLRGESACGKYKGGSGLSGW